MSEKTQLKEIKNKRRLLHFTTRNTQIHSKFYTFKKKVKHTLKLICFIAKEKLVYLQAI